jgi:hypothetical protein
MINEFNKILWASNGVSSETPLSICKRLLDFDLFTAQSKRCIRSGCIYWYIYDGVIAVVFNEDGNFEIRTK